MTKGAKKGFALIEILVGISIFTVLAIAVVAFVINNSENQRILFTASDREHQLRRALEFFVDEVRNVSTASTGSYGIESAADQSFIFYTNLDSDILRERVRYFLDGTDLKKGTIKPSGVPLAYDSGDEVVVVLVPNVTNGANPLFNYYDSSFTGTEDPLAQPVTPGDVRLINLSLTVDEDPNRPPGPVTVTVNAVPRNIKDNL